MQTSSPWLLLLTKHEPESVVKKCTVCARSAPSKSAETLKPHPVSTQPWQKIGTDLFQTNGQNYILVMDYYSLWPEVYQLHRMKDIFSWRGTPEELVSDNGTQYKSHLFCKFITAWGIHHITLSPQYPQSNGLAEAAVKMTKAKETSRNQARCHRRIADHPKHTPPMWIQPNPTSYGKKTERQSSVYVSIKQCYTKM